MKNQYCPKCKGIIVFIIASDDTLCLPQCTNGYGHLSEAEAEEAERLANIEWVEDNQNLMRDVRNEFLRMMIADLDKKEKE